MSDCMSPFPTRATVCGASHIPMIGVDPRETKTSDDIGVNPPQAPDKGLHDTIVRASNFSNGQPA